MNLPDEVTPTDAKERYDQYLADYWGSQVWVLALALTMTLTLTLTLALTPTLTSGQGMQVVHTHRVIGSAGLLGSGIEGSLATDHLVMFVVNRLYPLSWACTYLLG